MNRWKPWSPVQFVATPPRGGQTKDPIRGPAAHTSFDWPTSYNMAKLMHTNCLQKENNK